LREKNVLLVRRKTTDERQRDKGQRGDFPFDDLPHGY
jgi:hypothetical protein